MSAAVSYCRTLDGAEAAPTDVPPRVDGEDFCDAEVMCKCGKGPVTCCRGEHDGPHAAYGMRSRLLTVWENVNPVQVVAAELIASGAASGDGIHSWRCEYPEIYGACECVANAATDIVVALREAGCLA